MIDIREHGGSFGGGGIRSNTILPAGKFHMVDMVDTIVKRATGYLTTTIYAFAFNKVTNEVYALAKNAITIVVLDATTGDIKRSLTPSTGVGFNQIAVSDDGRLYVAYYNNNDNLCYVAELNPITGNIIKKVNLSANHTSVSNMGIINGQIHIVIGTGTIDIHGLDLTTKTAKIYNNSTANVEYGTHIDIEKNLIIYPQTSNGVTHAKKYSDGTIIANPNLWGNGMQSALTTQDFIIVTGASSLYKYDLTGKLLGNVLLYYEGGNGSAYTTKPFEIYPNVVVVPYQNSNMYGAIIVNLTAMKTMYINHNSLTGTGANIRVKNLLIEDRVFLTAAQEYTIQKMYQKII